MVNMAGADGLINCWSDKAAFSFWRPITAIHNGDHDGNRRTVGDPGWTSVALHGSKRQGITPFASLVSLSTACRTGTLRGSTGS